MTNTAGRVTGRDLEMPELTGLEVGAELGRGAFTTVHRARHGGQTYALKRPVDAAAEDSAFRREAALLACVDDPGVNRVHAAGRYEGAPALVLEFLAGGSLADHLGRAALEEERVVGLAAQLARGLAAAHRTGLVHRDVKPGNIMLAEDGSAKLIDFGLAQLGATGSDDDTAVGTFLYTSPEQSGMLKRPVDGRSDLYSLGVVLFECLTGWLPFEAGDVGELLRLHLAAAVPDVAALRPGVDPVLAAVVTRLLAKDPDDRYPTAADLLEGLRGCRGAAAGAPAADRWPLVARTAEHTELTARWQRARSGRGGVAVIRGPAGAGRSRLAEEVAAAAGDAIVLRAGCQQDDALPLAALRMALDEHLQSVARLSEPGRGEAEERLRGAATAAGAGLVAALSPRLAALLGDAARGSETRDDHVFTGAASFLGHLAQRHGGLLLVLDDAHWLDPGSREVLARLAAELPHLPLLVLLTERDGAGVPVEVAADLEIDCVPLDADGVAALVGSRLPGATVPATLAAHVAARTDGSPLAVVAYLLRLLDAGLLTPLWGDWHFDVAGADALPAADDIRAMLASRLAMLGPDDRDVLITAAVAGARFRPETLVAAGSAADHAVAVIGRAVDRRVLEVRPGGWYAFMHPLLREALLAEIGEDRLCLLHAAVAAALQSLAEDLRDADHVYAVARHHQRAGDAVPAEDRRRSALAAGLRALADQAPADAVGYLGDALDGESSPTSAVLHPLATAYLRDSRFVEAGEVLRRALKSEPDRRIRAQLLITRIEMHHTRSDDTRALADTWAALAELRRPLPGNGLVLVLSTLAVAAAGAVVRRTGWGFGTARGRRREELALQAAVLDAGGYAAAVGLRLREAGMLAMRALYVVNRLGHCPEYARVYALVGYVVSMIKMFGVSRRCLARAERVAAELGDPALVAYVEWIRGCGRLFSGQDDGEMWLDTITRQARWYGPSHLLAGFSGLGLRQLMRGYLTQAQSTYDRAMSRITDFATVRGTPLGMLAVMIPAMQGRPGDAAAALAELRAALGDTGTTVQRANVLITAASVSVEQGEFGEPLERIVDEFHGLRLRNRQMLPPHKWIYAYATRGRLARLEMATDADRPERLAAATAAVAQLKRVRRGSALLSAEYQIARATLAHLQGDGGAALRWCDRAERVARSADAPLVHFEVARLRARVFRRLDQINEADRQARLAVSLASYHGWESRRRQVRTEFGADNSGATGRRTHMARAEDGLSRRISALQQVGVAAATVLDPRELARVALDEMVRILGAERALFFLVSSGGEPVRFAGRGADSEDLAETTAYGTTLVRRVAETGEALVLTGTEQGAALGSQSAVVHGLRSILVAPVQFKGTTLGVVYLDSRMARGIFTDDDVEVLVGMTSHVAVSLETARAAQLHLAVRAAEQRQALAELLRASLAELSDIHEPADLLRRLFTMMTSSLDAAAGCLVGPDGTTVLEVAGGADPAALGAPLPVELPVDATPVTMPVPTALAEVLGGTATVLIVPLANRDGRAGTALLAADTFALDESPELVAAALADQGMSAYANARLFSRVQELATRDELTGQHNRRHFHALADALVKAAARGSRDLAAVMLDIDKFKNINDTYGHGVGDEVIRTVAGRVRAGIRGSDVLGRYGGEEFAVVLPDHGGGAVDLAERMRRAVADEPIATRAGPLPVTISVGLAQLDPADAGLDQLLARADHALYGAKEGGRNRVVLA